MANLGEINLEGIVKVEVKDIKRFPRRKVVLLCTIADTQFVRHLHVNDSWIGTLKIEVTT